MKLRTTTVMLLAASLFAGGAHAEVEASIAVEGDESHSVYLFLANDGTLTLLVDGEPLALPESPGEPEVPTTPEAPSVPEAPAPELPETPSVPQAPELPSFPPELPAIPALP